MVAPSIKMCAIDRAKRCAHGGNSDQGDGVTLASHRQNENCWTGALYTPLMIEIR